MSAAAYQDAAPAEQTCCELGAIFRQYGTAYARQHPLGPAQRQAVWAIAHCRTAALGGHRQWCPECGYERLSTVSHGR
jgi:hypothetical protein